MGVIRCQIFFERGSWMLRSKACTRHQCSFIRHQVYFGPFKVVYIPDKILFSCKTAILITYVLKTAHLSLTRTSDETFLDMQPTNQRDKTNNFEKASFCLRFLLDNDDSLLPCEDDNISTVTSQRDNIF